MTEGPPNGVRSVLEPRLRTSDETGNRAVLIAFVTEGILKVPRLYRVLPLKRSIWLCAARGTQSSDR
jgi:hypothetical protein